MPSGDINGDNSQNASRAAPKKRVLFIGAGISGIYFGMRAPEKLPDCEIKIVEKSPSLGGTWWENVYPGVACDTPAHTFTYEAEPNPNWSSCYANSHEIHSYLSGVAKKYNVEQYMQFKTRVIKIVWDEEARLWHVTLGKEQWDDDGGETGWQGEKGWDGGRRELLRKEGLLPPEDPSTVQKMPEWTEDYEFVVSGIGALNKWRWPQNLPGLFTFDESLITDAPTPASLKLIHTARWPKDKDGMARTDFLKGKTVAVIGTGASGVQVIPSIHNIGVKHLHVFSRSNCWTFPYRFKGDYTEEQKRNWANNVEELKAYRQQLQQEEEYRFKWFITTSPGQKQMLELAKAHLESQIPATKQELRDKAMPSYAIGCRRITPSDVYFETLAQDNVSYYRERLDHVEPGTIVLDNGKRIEGIDIVVCATGFDTSFVPSFEVIGLGGVPLRERWSGKGKNAEAFHGHSVHGYPNFLSCSFPNVPYGQGTIIGVSQAGIAYIITLIRGMIDNGVRSVHPRKDKQDEFNKFCQDFLKQTVWTENCTCWYKDPETDHVVAIWPGPQSSYRKAVSIVLWDVFEIDWETPELAKELKPIDVDVEAEVTLPAVPDEVPGNVGSAKVREKEEEYLRSIASMGNLLGENTVAPL